MGDTGILVCRCPTSHAWKITSMEKQSFTFTYFHSLYSLLSPLPSSVNLSNHCNKFKVFTCCLTNCSVFLTYIFKCT